MLPSDFPPANKRLGQNFLIDHNIVRKIVAAADIGQDSTVLEVGPGRGILTEALSAAAGRVVAVEIDPLLCQMLENRQAKWPNVEFICADALSYPLDQLPVGTIVVANLPYYVSTPLLFRLLDARRRFPRLVLMLQEEVVDRLVAKPGGSEYGVLSVMAQYAADIHKSFRVSAQCFRPRPEVGSAVVRLLVRERSGLTAEAEREFRLLVKAAFAHRRKTLINSLRDEGYLVSRATDVLNRLGFPLNARAETLSVSDFIALTGQFRETN
ncbi:Ribosomal RNA small subunit methyltransferase A [Nitrospira sp. KM1]|uniref:16S rRNA (adenine(1518)-N(6)/adenine(1519)-N(6))- dimethyltransferase RsmA n=1 Tax=Nitrospira sp. KM1 TaxID=1936990 RepID=UPI0013A710F9|nr:16S rRNA (adenine(1518)-N(6)/adenine(1519)-N(6))-dimethyltransferase RsmA [Nitrospira sp. KM1]BCA55689.1 Ribosomal RNA small subunit methyltransferase A [Nitrospira sp. KM1]